MHFHAESDRIPEEVRRGVNLLDMAFGFDWRKQVRKKAEAGKLDMMNERKCVLGHIYGSFQQGLGQLVSLLRTNGHHAMATTLKHCPTDFGFIPGQLRGGPALTVSWKKALGAVAAN